MAVVEMEFDDGVAHVRLNRPARKNALSLDMFEDLAVAGEKVRGMPDLRAVILSGAGGDFCAGLDLAVMQDLGARVEDMRARLARPVGDGPANWFQKPVTVWQDLPVPVIAAVEGVCLGGGMQLALAADFRIVHPSARLSLMEAKWGLVPDMGVSQSLPKLMRADQAKWLMMQADILSAVEADALGLVTEISEDPATRALDMARALAGKSPDAVAGVKRLVEQTWCLPPGEGLKIEARIQAPILGSPNQAEAVAANLERRAPVFRNGKGGR